MLERVGNASTKKEPTEEGGDGKYRRNKEKGQRRTKKMRMRERRNGKIAERGAS